MGPRPMVYSNRATGARNRIGRRELTFVRETDSWVLGDAWPRNEREERDWLYGADDLCEAWNDMSLSEKETSLKDETAEEGKQPAVRVEETIRELLRPSAILVGALAKMPLHIIPTQRPRAAPSSRPTRRPRGPVEEMVGGARVLESRASHLSSMESDEIARPVGDDPGDEEALALAVANRRFPAAPKFIDLVPLSPQSSSSGSSAPASHPPRSFPNPPPPRRGQKINTATPTTQPGPVRRKFSLVSLSSVGHRDSTQPSPSPPPTASSSSSQSKQRRELPIHFSPLRYASVLRLDHSQNGDSERSQQRTPSHSQSRRSSEVSSRQEKTHAESRATQTDGTDRAVSRRTAATGSEGGSNGSASTWLRSNNRESDLGSGGRQSTSNHRHRPPGRDRSENGGRETGTGISGASGEGSPSSSNTTRTPSVIAREQSSTTLRPPSEPLMVPLAHAAINESRTGGRVRPSNVRRGVTTTRPGARGRIPAGRGTHDTDALQRQRRSFSKLAFSTLPHQGTRREGPKKTVRPLLSPVRELREIRAEQKRMRGIKRRRYSFAGHHPPQPRKSIHMARATGAGRATENGPDTNSHHHGRRGDGQLFRRPDLSRVGKNRVIYRPPKGQATPPARKFFLVGSGRTRNEAPTATVAQKRRGIGVQNLTRVRGADSAPLH